MDLFLIEDGKLLEKYNTIWDKVNVDIKKEIDKVLSPINILCKPK